MKSPAYRNLFFKTILVIRKKDVETLVYISLEHKRWLNFNLISFLTTTETHSEKVYYTSSVVTSLW